MSSSSSIGLNIRTATKSPHHFQTRMTIGCSRATSVVAGKIPLAFLRLAANEQVLFPRLLHLESVFSLQRLSESDARQDWAVTMCRFHVVHDEVSLLWAAYKQWRTDCARASMQLDACHGYPRSLKIASSFLLEAKDRPLSSSAHRLLRLQRPSRRHTSFVL